MCRRGMALLLFDTLLLLLPLSGWAESNLPTYYMQSGAQRAIEIDTLRIALRVVPALNIAPDSVFASNELLDLDPTRMEFYPTQKVLLGPLSAKGDSLGVEAVYDSLRHDPLIDFTGLVVRVQSSGHTMVLANELVVAYRQGFGPAYQQVVHDSLHLSPAPRNARRPERLVLRPDSRSPLDALRAANRLAEHYSAAVRYAHPDFMIPLRLQDQCGTNDAFIGAQWHLNNPGPEDADVDAFEAWCVTRGDAQVLIAVIDNGVWLDHPDLNLVPKDPSKMRDFYWSSACDSDPAGCADWDPSPDDSDPHGTRVSGVVAAIGGNTIGVSGVCPACRVLPFRVGAGSAVDQADAFREAKDQGAWVIVCAWDFGPINSDDSDAPTDDFIAAVDDAALNGRNGRGIVVIFPAVGGGSACDNTLASLQTVVAVARSTIADVIPASPPSGLCLDLLAPGQTIWTTNFSTSDPYDAFGGVSAATAIVGGVAGLVLSQCPERSASEVRDLMIATADKIPLSDPGSAGYNGAGFSLTYGYGRVNAFAAVQAASDPSCGVAPYCVADVTVEGGIIHDTWDPGDPLTVSGTLRRTNGGSCALGTPVVNVDSLIVYLNPPGSEGAFIGQHMLCGDIHRIALHPGTDPAGHFQFTITGGGPSWLVGDGVQFLASWIQLVFKNAGAVVWTVSAGNSALYPLPQGSNANWIYGVLASPDLNGDGIVDATDQTWLEGLVGLPITLQSGWQADFNHDGFVDSSDVAYFAGRFGQSCEGPMFATEMDARNLADEGIRSLMRRSSLTVDSVCTIWNTMGLTYDHRLAQRARVKPIQKGH